MIPTLRKCTTFRHDFPEHNPASELGFRGEAQRPLERQTGLNRRTAKCLEESVADTETDAPSLF